MIPIFITLIRSVAQILSVLIIIDAVLSFFLSPFHPVRETLGKVLNPLYAPIRRVLPPMGGIDFSPLILIILIQVIESLLISLISSLG
ncbi:YggT family protein [Anaerolinea sp.]|uniref:YggT family protein n=1 Tax=Anaerolinea sp. TaxID=1872519 RepID=UPI002ACE69DC|nr:YggT family protein [Anaerolinea sp.]